MSFKVLCEIAHIIKSEFVGKLSNLNIFDGKSSLCFKDSMRINDLFGCSVRDQLAGDIERLISHTHQISVQGHIL